MSAVYIYVFMHDMCSYNNDQLTRSNLTSPHRFFAGVPQLLFTCSVTGVLVRGAADFADGLPLSIAGVTGPWMGVCKTTTTDNYSIIYSASKRLIPFELC